MVHNWCKEVCICKYIYVNELCAWTDRTMYIYVELVTQKSLELPLSLKPFPLHFTSIPRREPLCYQRLENPNKQITLSFTERGGKEEPSNLLWQSDSRCFFQPKFNNYIINKHLSYGLISCLYSLLLVLSKQRKLTLTLYFMM